MIQRTEKFKQFPLNIAGSSTFGRYPKISLEKTYNMFISDGWLVDYAGYKSIRTISSGNKGRGLYASSRINKMIAVLGNTVYSIDNGFNVANIGTIETFAGDVFIDENNINQIAICDKSQLYFYNYVANTFTKATADGTNPIDFTPGYVTFHDGRFISPNVSPVNNPAQWRLSLTTDGSQWPDDAQHVGAIQTKPDYAVATQRFPGRGNLILIMGSNVTELWNDVGLQLFPYQRNNALSIDYGCLNPATIAATDNVVMYLAGNELSGPQIMVTTGSEIKPVHTDGIDFLLTHLSSPESSSAFFFKQDGHLIYQITFYDPKDNLTILYDFSTDKFYKACDQNQNYHIAKEVVFFNNAYYFLSFNDGNLYQMDTTFTTFQTDKETFEIPRIRICPPVRFPDSSYFVVNSGTFTMEMGTETFNVSNQCSYLAEENGTVLTEEFLPSPTQEPVSLCEENIFDPFALRNAYQPRVDLNISTDGGYTFGSEISYPVNPIGDRKNRIVYWGLGAANDFTVQVRFWGFGRFLATNGELGIYR